jgi:hypothetical protein
MSKEISLAREYPTDSPMSISAASPRGPDYPTFHYEGPEELDLPDKGELTIKFRKTSETSSVDKSGKHWYACTIEVQSICDVDDGDEDDQPEAPARGSDKAVSDILDSLMEKHMESKDKENY